MRESLAGIRSFFEARSVALVGASERPGSLGTVVLANLLASGFHGAIHAVHPQHQTVQGLTCYRSVRDLPEPVDLVVILSPAATVPAIFADCAARGVGAAVVLSAGFREVGEAGQRLEHEATAAARRHGIRFIGPNCLGVMRPDIGLNATFSQCMAKPGSIALVSQSGAMCTAMLDWAAPRQIGFSCVISSGIAADVDFGELLDYLVFDPATRAIMLYVEGVHDARRFLSALRSAARAKPVIVMKAGRYAEGQRAAISHTGALVGSDDVFDAALRRAGVVRVDDYADFFAVAETLHTGARTPGPRLLILTNGGGPGVMAADFLADRHLPLAQLAPATTAILHDALPAAGSCANPVDVLGDASPERYAAAAAACFADDGVDAVLAILVPQAMSEPDAVAQALLERAADRRNKPLLTCWMGDATTASSRELFRRAGVPTYATPKTAIVSFEALAAHRANQVLLQQVPEPLRPRARPDRDGARQILEAARQHKRKVLSLLESKAVLAAFGVDIVQSIPAHDPVEALAIAESIGFPVVMKIHSSAITHKTDVGGVRLGISNGQEVRTAYRELIETVQARSPESPIDGVLIEPSWHPSDGRELMLGVVNDAVFGPAISVGLGGTMVEILRDRAIGLPPLNRFLAARMIDGTRAQRYLQEFRGKPAANRAAVEDAILRLSELVCELPGVAEVDINPLVVDRERAVALDARIVIRDVSPAAREYAHMAIHPYPSRLVGEHVLADGTRLVIRPIRPEDAVTEREFVDHLSDRSRYLRFMYAFRTISADMLSRFTQIDYDREMALIALMPQGTERERQIAVARYVVDPIGRDCEFAIVVADDWHGRGLGSELLRRLIDVARERRLVRMCGLVLKENTGMIALAKQLGFEQRAALDDPTVIEMSFAL